MSARGLTREEFERVMVQALQEEGLSPEEAEKGAKQMMSGKYGRAISATRDSAGVMRLDKDN